MKLEMINFSTFDLCFWVLVGVCSDVIYTSPLLNDILSSLRAQGCCPHLGVVARCGKLPDHKLIPSGMALMRQVCGLVWLFNFDSQLWSFFM